MSDRIYPLIYASCVQCHGFFEKRFPTQLCCCAKCNGIYYANLRKVALKDKPQIDLTKGERILKEMRNL